MWFLVRKYDFGVKPGTPEYFKEYRKHRKKEIAEYNSKTYLQRGLLYYRRKKIRAIQILGSCCFACGIKYDGSNAAIFAFHHYHFGTKNETLEIGDRSLATLPEPEMIEEVHKCALLCENCHRMVHYYLAN